MISEIESFAHSKTARKGKCAKSCFANGYHRIGVVPMYSVLDGGCPGDSSIEICLECGKEFKKSRWFIPISQPRTLTPTPKL